MKCILQRWIDSAPIDSASASQAHQASNSEGEENESNVTLAYLDQAASFSVIEKALEEFLKIARLDGNSSGINSHAKHLNLQCRFSFSIEDSARIRFRRSRSRKRIQHHVGAADNYNVTVVGRSGAGKSA